MGTLHVEGFDPNTAEPISQRYGDVDEVQMEPCGTWLRVRYHAHPRTGLTSGTPRQTSWYPLRGISTIDLVEDES